MLRINLLPAYIAERKKTRNALILASIVWLAVLGIGLGYQFGYLQPHVISREAEADDEQRKADAVTQLGKDAEAERAKIAPIKDKVDFVKAVRFANKVRQRIYRNAARYTYRRVEYNQMAVNGDSLSVAGFVKNTDDLGRFYITMFGNPDVTAVSIQGIPSYPNQQTFDPASGGPSPAEAGWFPVQLSATLVKPVVTPNLPASVAGGATTGGFGGGPGFGGSGAPTTSSFSGSSGSRPGGGPAGGRASE